MAMTAATAEVGGGGQRRRQMTTMAMADDDSSGQRRQRMTTSRVIGRWTTRGKEESGWQTTTALDKRLTPPGRECEKNKEIRFTQKDFFQRYGLSGWIFPSRKNSQCALLILSVLFVICDGL